MGTFLSWYAGDVLIYSLVSFWHAFFLLIMGWVSAQKTLLKLNALILVQGANVSINDGVRLMLFATLFGAMNFIAGHMVGGKQETIMSMLGFNTQLDSASQTITSSTTTSTGATSTTTSSTTQGKRPKDFKSLFLLENTW